MNSPRSFRTTELAKELARQGHNVTVLTPKKPEHAAFEKKHGLVIEDLGQPKWKAIALRGKGVGLLFRRAVRRLSGLLLEYPNLEYFFKVKKALKKKQKKKEHYDLLISIAVPYPIHWGVAAVWKKKNNIAKTWVADCGDPYFIQENDTLPKPFYFKWVEKWFMRKADFITVPTDTSYRGYFPEFHDKLEVIPQGFKFEEIIKQKEIKDGVIRFGYGGSFTLHRRDPSELLEFLTSLDDSYKFEFHIYSNNRNFVDPYSTKDDRIKLHQPIPRTELLNKLSAFQFVVNMANFGTSQTPSKLIDYGIIGKPVLEIQTGKLDKNNVLAFLNGNYHSAVAISNIDQYRIDNVVRQFLKLAPYAQSR